MNISENLNCPTPDCFDNFPSENLTNTAYVDADTEFEDSFSYDDLFAYSETSDEESRRLSEARLWYNSNNSLFEKGDWKSIYQNLLRLGQLEQSVIWNDVKCLSLAQFAVSQLAFKLLSIRKWSSANRAMSNEYRVCFLKLVNQSISLKPNEDKFHSSKAYFFYFHYMSNHHEENDFQEACVLLKDLSQSPFIRFKDAQRYIRIRQKKWEGYNHTDDSKLYELSLEYETLIEIYETLSQREKIRFQKNYISCEYNYSKINIKLLWEETVKAYFWFLSSWMTEDKLQEWKNPESDSSLQRKSVINKCFNFLNDIAERIPESDTIESVQNKNKVRFIEIDYRKAQLLDIKGMLCLIAGVSIERISYFTTASNLLKQSFDKVDSLQRQIARFNYPWYSKCPYALAEFANKHYGSACALLLSVPQNINTRNYYIAARSLLSRMLPFLPEDILFQNCPNELHVIICYPITESIISDLRKAGFIPESINYSYYRLILDGSKPIGYSEFLSFISEVYMSSVPKQSYTLKQKAIMYLRSAIANYVHYTPENDISLKTTDDRMIAMYYIGVRKMMKPAKKRDKIERYKIMLACSAIFQKEIIAELTYSIKS